MGQLTSLWGVFFWNRN